MSNESDVTIYRIGTQRSRDDSVSRVEQCREHEPGTREATCDQGVGWMGQVSCPKNTSPFYRRFIPSRSVAFARRPGQVASALAPCEPGDSTAEFRQLIFGTEHWEIGIRGLIIGVVVTWKRGSTIQDRLRLLRLTTTRRADITSFTPEVKGISVLPVTDSHSRPPGS